MQLTDYEKKVLVDVLDMHLDEMDNTRDQMIDDTSTLDTFDKLTTTLQSHEIMRAAIESIKQKVLEEDDSD